MRKRANSPFETFFKSPEIDVPEIGSRLIHIAIGNMNDTCTMLNFGLQNSQIKTEKLTGYYSVKRKNES